jgi:hypothetical protein
MESRNIIPGLLLIVIGAVILLANLGIFSLVGLWPLAVIILGVFFFILWLKDREDYGLLMPAAILTIVGCLFFYCEQNGWHHMSNLWPVFMIAPGFGFILMYVFGDQEPGLLIPGTIMLVIGIFFLSINEWVGRWWPIILIMLGVLLLFRPPKKIAPADTADADRAEPDETMPDAEESQ